MERITRAIEAFVQAKEDVRRAAEEEDSEQPTVVVFALGDVEATESD